VILADAHLGDGEVDQACQLGTQALEFAAQLQSHRTLNYLQAFQQRLNLKADRYPRAQRFSEQLDSVIQGGATWD
jgi:hypothetical protein